MEHSTARQLLFSQSLATCDHLLLFVRLVRLLHGAEHKVQSQLALPGMLRAFACDMRQLRQSLHFLHGPQFWVGCESTRLDVLARGCAFSFRVQAACV